MNLTLLQKIQNLHWNKDILWTLKKLQASFLWVEVLDSLIRRLYNSCIGIST